jgi:hypothetical protein
MAYTKPEVLAQNSKEGVFAAGCPSRDKASPAAYQACAISY